MKLFYFITKSEAGGAQTHVMQLARCFSEQGHEVTIMSQPGGWLADAAKNLGVNYLPNPHLANTMNPILLIRAARVLKKALHVTQPDLISCHSTIAGLVGRLSIRGSIPTIFTAHGWGFAPRIKEPRRSIVKLAEKLAARWSKKIVCVSDYDLELAKRAGIKNVVRIHNGVEPFASKQRSNTLLEALFVGRLVPQKDPMILLQAINNLDQTIKAKLHVSMIGSGSLEEEVRAYILKHDLVNTVTLTPVLPRTEVMKKMKDSNLFILTSHWEGLPRSILEAMSHGLPVIASDVGGVSDAVTNDTGILIPHADQKALEKALIQLIEHSELRTRLGRAAQHLAHTHFSLERMCKKTAGVYQAVLH